MKLLLMELWALSFDGCLESDEIIYNFIIPMAEPAVL